jgi:hypothetical protein
VATPPRSARLAYDVASDALKEQLARIDSLDQKAGIVLAAGGIVGGLVLRPGDRLADPSPGSTTDDACSSAATAATASTKASSRSPVAHLLAEIREA